LSPRGKRVLARLWGIRWENPRGEERYRVEKIGPRWEKRGAMQLAKQITMPSVYSESGLIGPREAPKKGAGRKGKGSAERKCTAKAKKKRGRTWLKSH